MTEPLVSVIIPVYNHEKYIDQALNSIFNQSYPNLEIIIIDDGSKDRSCEKIEEALKRFKPCPGRKVQFITQENQGAHVTINRGLALATGDWLTILNSDDYYHHDRIKVMLEQSLAAKAEFAFSYVVGIDEQNRFLPDSHWWKRWYERTRFELYNKAPTVGFILLEHNFAVSTGNLFFSRDVYKRVGNFKDYKLAHDLDFIVRALPFYEPLVVRENLYFYRIHSQNTQHKVSHLAEEELSKIHCDYLISVYGQPPENKQAPSLWYWPSEFAKLREELNFDRGLKNLLIKIPPMTRDDKFLTIEVTKVTEKKIPITLISHEMSLSGAPKLVADLAMYFKSKGYLPNIISLTDGPMKHELEKEGIPVHILKKTHKGGNSISSLLFAICFKIKGRVIANSIMSWPMVIPLTVLRPRSRPIWYIHESISLPGVMQGVKRKIVAPFLKLCKKYSPPRLWFGSAATKKTWDYSDFPNGKVMYWSGVPQQEQKPKAGIALKNLLCVGSVCSRKGTHTLVEAFLNCLDEKRIPEDTILSIVGFPSQVRYEDSIVAEVILKVIRSKFRNNIKMIQSVTPNQLDQFFAQADLFIQSSVLECLPIALLTAMSLGLPIITTNVDGCAEVIEDRQTGLFCRPFDVTSLAEAIAEAINNPDKSAEMGKKAHGVFNEKYSLEKTRERFLAEIRET